MKKKILLSIISFTFSFALLAENSLFLSINDMNDNEVDNLEVPLSVNKNLSISANGNVFASTTLEEITTAIENTNNISIGGKVPTFVCSGDISCNLVPFSSTDITSTINTDAVYCVTYLNNEFIKDYTPTNSQPYIENFTRTIIDGGKYTVICDDSLGNSVSASININLTAAPSVKIDSLDSSSVSVANGTALTFQWSFTNNPINCEFLGSWPVNYVIPATSPATVVTQNINQGETLTVQCQNSAGFGNVASKVISIAGSSSSSWTSCTNGDVASPILSGAEDRTILSTGGTPALYNGMFEQFQGVSGSSPWPGQGGDNIKLSLSKNMYIAAKFTTSNQSYNDWVFKTTTPTNFEGPNSLGKTMEISTCPGDFTGLLGVNCITDGSSLDWSTEAKPGTCHLNKNTTYYLNIVQSDNFPVQDNFATTDCNASGEYCGIFAVPNNNESTK